MKLFFILLITVVSSNVMAKSCKSFQNVKYSDCTLTYLSPTDSNENFEIGNSIKGAYVYEVADGKESFKEIMFFSPGYSNEIFQIGLGSPIKQIIAEDGSYIERSVTCFEKGMTLRSKEVYFGEDDFSMINTYTHEVTFNKDSLVSLEYVTSHMEMGNRRTPETDGGYNGKPRSKLECKTTAY